MAWVVVDKSGAESVHECEPRRWEYSGSWRSDNELDIPSGSIEKLIGRKLSWTDEPVELFLKQNKMENKLGQEHAFPTDRSDGRGMWSKENTGMSKRFYAACAAMQGLASNPKGFIQADDTPHTAESFIENAYILADELLRQENE